MRPIASSSPRTFAAPATKIASIVLPIIMVTVPFAPALQQHAVLRLIITSAPSKFPSHTPQHTDHSQLTQIPTTVLSCWAVGGVCIVAILIKYIYHLASFKKIESSRSTDLSLASTLGKTPPLATAPQTDKWLLLRFTFTFVALRYVSAPLSSLNRAFPISQRLNTDSHRQRLLRPDNQNRLCPARSLRAPRRHARARLLACQHNRQHTDLHPRRATRLHRLPRLRNHSFLPRDLRREHQALLLLRVLAEPMARQEN